MTAHFKTRSGGKSSVIFEGTVVDGDAKGTAEAHPGCMKVGQHCVLGQYRYGVLPISTVVCTCHVRCRIQILLPAFASHTL